MMRTARSSSIGPQPEGLHQEDRNYATEQRKRPVARLPHDDDGEHAGDDELDDVESVEHQPPDAQPERRRDSRGAEFERRLDHRDADDEAEPQERQGNGDQLFDSSHAHTLEIHGARVDRRSRGRDGLERLLEPCSGAQLDQREELAFLEADVRLEERAGALQRFGFDLPHGETRTQLGRQRVQPRMVEQRTHELLRSLRSGLLEQERKEAFLLVAKMRHPAPSKKTRNSRAAASRALRVTGCRTGAACGDEGTVVMVREWDEGRVPSHDNLSCFGRLARHGSFRSGSRFALGSPGALRVRIVRGVIGCGQDRTAGGAVKDQHGRDIMFLLHVRRQLDRTAVRAFGCDTHILLP